MLLEGNMAVEVLIEIGEEKGFDRGLAEIKIETAHTMLEEGFTIQQIAKILKQPIEWVKNLQANV
ncbi:MAG: hypothetical protein FWG64_01575 [Firmicutes bacterium]|nr:hypothetical protein [Bacillota bacterium]